MYRLILLRHGESTWNKKNLFTGWTDVPLSTHGVQEAKAAGKALKKYKIDLVYTSFLKRAKQTTNLVLREIKQEPVIIQSWRLNERHYGALQGLSKSATAKKYGEQQVQEWRRSFNVRPPALKSKDERLPSKDPLYKEVKKNLLPRTECLKDTVARVKPYWEKEIKAEIKEGKNVLISAHGNSLRALIKILDKVPAKEIAQLNIPTGIPLIYELNDKLRPIKHYYLADKKTLDKAIGKVKNQGKAA